MTDEIPAWPDTPRHDTLMHIEAGAFGADVLGCPRCDAQRARFHDAMEDQILNPGLTEKLEALEERVLTILDIATGFTGRRFNDAEKIEHMKAEAARLLADLRRMQ